MDKIFEFRLRKELREIITTIAELTTSYIDEKIDRSIKRLPKLSVKDYELGDEVFKNAKVVIIAISSGILTKTTHKERTCSHEKIEAVILLVGENETRLVLETADHYFDSYSDDEFEDIVNSVYKKISLDDIGKGRFMVCG